MKPARDTTTAASSVLLIALLIASPASAAERGFVVTDANSPLHSPRMVFVDYGGNSTEVYDYSNYHNPSGKPFDGEAAVTVPPGAEVLSVMTVQGTSLPYQVERNGSRVVFPLYLSPDGSGAIGVRYLVNSGTVELRADHAANVMVLAIGVERSELEVEGLEMEPYGRELTGGVNAAVATGSFGEGDTFSVSLPQERAAPALEPIYLVLVAAVALALRRRRPG